VQIFKVHLYNAKRELTRTVRIHAPDFTGAGTIALNRYPEDKAAFAVTRIR